MSYHRTPFIFSSGDILERFKLILNIFFGFFCMQSCIATDHKILHFIWITKKKSQEEDFKNSYSYLQNLLFYFFPPSADCIVFKKWELIVFQICSLLLLQGEQASTSENVMFFSRRWKLANPWLLLVTALRVIISFVSVMMILSDQGLPSGCWNLGRMP